MNGYEGRRDAAIQLAATQAAPLFRLFGWTWGEGDNEHVPTHNELVRCLKGLVRDVEQSGEDGGTSTGRFGVTRFQGDISIELSLANFEIPDRETDQ